MDGKSFFCTGYGILLMLALLACDSCVPYRNLELEVLRPAERIAVGRAGMVLADRNVWDRESDLQFQDEGMGSLLTQDLGNGLNSRFLELRRDTAKVISLRAGRTEKGIGEPFVPLDSGVVASSCTAYGADYLLVVESHRFMVRYEGIDCMPLLCLYRKDGRIADSARLAVRVDLPGFTGEGEVDASQDIRAAYWDLGREYLERIAPYWDWTVRRVCVHGRWLGLASALWQEGRVEEAAGIWDRLAGRKDRTGLAARLNRITALEYEGRLEEAVNGLEDLIWRAGQMGWKKGMLAYLSEYREELKKRIKGDCLLEMQM